jgi:uncharacterized protein YoaH (UPF0181 family)
MNDEFNQQRKEDLTELKSSLSKEAWEEVNKERRLGKSTADALAIVAEALRNPNQPIKLYDHAAKTWTPILDHITIPNVQKVIESMGLKSFSLNKADKTLTYKVTFYNYEDL